MQAGNLLIRGLFGEMVLASTREIFARNLKFWLKKRDISGAELARRLGGIDPSTVSHWLRKVSGPDLKTLGEVADVLEVPPWYLLHEAGSAMPDGHLPPEGPSSDEADRVLLYIADRLGRDIKIKPRTS